MECPFKVGDKIRHKATEKPAVVLKIITECVSHTAYERWVDSMRQAINLPPKYGPFEFVYSGDIQIEDWDGRIRTVSGNSYEKV